MKLPNASKDKITAIASGVALSSTLAFSSAFADDTEVFFGQVTSNSDTHPNVMFVLDTSGSMDKTDGTGVSRLERMKDAMYTILDETTNVNVGLMRFNGHEGGGAVLHPVRAIDGLVCEGAECGTLSLVAKVNESAGDVVEVGGTPTWFTPAPTTEDPSPDPVEIMPSGPKAMDLAGDSLVVGKIPSGSSYKVGLHYGKLSIPQGATITSARLEFRADVDNTSIANFNIGAEQVDSAALYTNADDDLSNRILGKLAPWAPKAWLENLDYQSSDISDVIQQVIDRPDWCGGNNMNIIIEGKGQRAIRSYEKWETTAPTLRLNYTTENVSAGGGCMRYPALSSVSSGRDDAEERLSDGNVRTGSPDLEMPRDGGSQQMVGVRFPNLDIPQGAIIESAFIEFTTDSDQSSAITMSISAQDIGHAPRFRSRWKNISKRTPTTAVPWINPPSVGAGQPVDTPNLSVALQEVISRNDWVRGNAAAFLITGAANSGMRDYRAFDQYPNTPPKLKVIYRGVVDSASSAQVTMREKYKSIINEMVAHDGTPIVDAYYEASLYMTGKNVDYGRNRGTTVNSWSEPRYQRVSHPLSWKDGEVERNSACSDGNLNSTNCESERLTGAPTYISPMVSSCQTNHIVFLTDGEPTSNDSSAKVRTLIGATDQCSTQGTADERCGRELATWLHDTDHNPSLSGKQNISTYTIGFNYDGDFLKDIAREGEGQYFKAESSSQLVGVFKDILGDVLAVDTSFVAPGATVNQFNRLTHRNDIYFALFKPDSRPTWDGNLKRYEVNPDATGEISILDANRNSAVDESTGFFHAESQSWWSDVEDGNTVAKGGAAEELFWDQTGDIPNRRTFTFLDDYSTIPAVTGADLTVPKARLHEGNDDITLDHLGIQNIVATSDEKTAFRSDLLKWIRGVDIKDANDDNDVTDYRKTMGDPMHARPVILNYKASPLPLSTVFVGTNEGYIHAIEREEGKELYAYMPKELISNIRPFFDNQSSSSHPYGMDGALSVWTDDPNNNVMIDPGEKAYIYSGMRRGGNNYYALDVSNRISPTLKWVIEGGADGTLGFEELGQTWSRAIPNRIMFEGEERNVLIFAAGYDTNQDPDPAGLVMEQTPDSVGRGFYIVDAVTGEHIYSVLGSNSPLGDSLYMPELKYSVPGNIRALDTNSDGFTDQLYFGDLGGQIWRFDFAQYHQSADGDLLTGGIIADLNGNNPQNHRRFYYEPDVAVIAHEGDRFLSISIGTGWRAHPLNQEVDDRFYVLRSYDVLSAPAEYGMLDPNNDTYRPIVESDLVDITNDIDAEVGPHGWYLALKGNGEKVLGNSVTVNNQVIFSSYKPTVAATACTTAIGGGAVYVLNILNGSPRIDLDGDGDVDEDDRSTELAHGGIPPEPAVLITENGPTVLVGPEQPVDPDFQNLTQRTYWFKPGDDVVEELVEVTGN